MDEATLEKLLEVSAPWGVIDARHDLRSRQIEVHVGMIRSGWFGGARVIRQGNVRTFSWWHLALAGRRVRMRVDCPNDMPLPRTGWSGNEDSPFTHALSQRLLAIFAGGATLIVASTVLDLDPEEVWRFKRRHDLGKIDTTWQPPEPESEIEIESEIEARAEAKVQVRPEPKSRRRKVKTVAVAMPVRADTTKPAMSIELPEAGHRIWSDLVSGKSGFEISHLGLQLFLARLRAQSAQAFDEDGRRRKAAELRRFFEVNPAFVPREIEAIKVLAR